MKNSPQKLLHALGKIESAFKDDFGEAPSKEVIRESLRERLDELKKEKIMGTVRSLAASDVLFLLDHLNDDSSTAESTANQDNPEKDKS